MFFDLLYLVKIADSPRRKRVVEDYLGSREIKRSFQVSRYEYMTCDFSIDVVHTHARDTWLRDWFNETLMWCLIIKI